MSARLKSLLREELGFMTTKFPIVAGIFEIVFACWSMLFGSIGVVLFAVWQHAYMYMLARVLYHPQFLLSICGLIVFAFGLVGGIFAIKRTRFVLTLVGAFSILFWSVLYDWLAIGTWYPYYTVGHVMVGLLIGNLPILFSALSLAFLLASRKEFT